jgi:hypothetical protein
MEQIAGTLAINGAHLYYEQAGSPDSPGHPLLLIHGVCQLSSVLLSHPIVRLYVMILIQDVEPLYLTIPQEALQHGKSNRAVRCDHHWCRA